MANIKKGRLSGNEKKIALRDEKDVRKEAKELSRETQRDMFNPARMTTRYIDNHMHEIDHTLEKLEKYREDVRTAHGEYSEYKNTVSELKTNRKRLALAKKAKKTGAKNTEVVNALKGDVKQHTHRHILSLLNRKKGGS